MPREIDIIVEAGLRVPQGNTGQHIGKQREHRQRIKCIRIDGAPRRRAAVEIAYCERHRFGNKGIVDFDVVRSGSAQSGRVPGVVDFVVALGKQKDPVFDPVGFIVGRNDAGQHVPFAGIDPRRERPTATQHITAVDFPGAAGRKYEGGCDQRVGVLVPDQVLRARVEHAQHPVVACQIGEIPRHRRIALAERIGAIHQRDIIEFGAADPLRLHHPEQTGFMQIALGLIGQTPQLLGAGRAIEQARNERFGAGNHGRIGAVIRIRPRGQARVRLPANTCHGRFLAIASRQDRLKWSNELFIA